jgi:hypothetical protein
MDTDAALDPPNDADPTGSKTLQLTKFSIFGSRSRRVEMTPKQSTGTGGAATGTGGAVTGTGGAVCKGATTSVEQ